MGQFIIQSFANGLDLRRSADTAPPGSLRVLRNATINEGGEIEKRKAFVPLAPLTSYAQTYKGRIAGPYPIPGTQDTVFFRHLDVTRPSTGGWTVGVGSYSSYLNLHGTGQPFMRAWAMAAPVRMTDFGAMFHCASYAEYAAKAHIMDAWWSSDLSTNQWGTQHLEVEFNSDFEPIADDKISENGDWACQIVLRQKGYVVRGDTWKASALNDPGDMAGTGSGAVDMRTQSSSIGNGLALGEYFGDLVVFGTRGAQFWSVDPDFTKNQYLRSLKTSLLARRSVTGYADGDVLYLSTTGIRSLQARDSSNFAKVSDVGSPIDILLRAELDFAGADVEPIFQDHDRNVTRFLQLAKGIIHEQSGQFWLCLKEKVYVLTNYPAAKVRAWSVFDLPVTTHFNPTVGLLKGRWVGDICAIRDDLIMRNNADEVFIYGGITGSTYDRSEVEVVTPHMDMGKPSTVKRFTGIDMACYGEWQVEVSLDVNNVEWEPVAVIDGSTHRVYRVGFDLEGTHLALRLRSTTPGPAKIGQVTVLYAGGEGEK